MDIESDLDNDDEATFYTAAHEQDDDVANDQQATSPDSSDTDLKRRDLNRNECPRKLSSQSDRSGQKSSKRSQDVKASGSDGNILPLKHCPLHGFHHSSHNGSEKPDTVKASGDLAPSPGASSTTSSMSKRRPSTKEHLFKILVIGELATGKTSFIKRYVHQFFSDHYRATIGVDFALKVLNWDESTLVRLQLWDIAGQERFGNMTRVYYKEAVGAFVVFDVERPPTFEAVTKWKTDLDSKVSFSDGSSVPVILLANKADGPKEGPAASPDFLDTFCSENGFAGWYYTSAKENLNVEESARFLVGKILQRKRAFESDDEEDGDSDVLNLDHQRQESQASGSSGKCSC